MTEKQDRFVRLIAHGVSNGEACRLVGINPQDRDTVATRAHDREHCG